MMKANNGYEKRVHKILKTYNSILVRCQNVPTISDKNIVFVEDIAGMINAQIEIRKPILYFQEQKCTSFILLDGNEGYIYILKADCAEVSKVEQVIDNCEYVRSRFLRNILLKVEKVLSDVDGKSLLTEKEQQYLDSIKEETNEAVQGTPSNLSLVPTQKKNIILNFFSKYKKNKVLNTTKNEEKMKIV